MSSAHLFKQNYAQTKECDGARFRPPKIVKCGRSHHSTYKELHLLKHTIPSHTQRGSDMRRCDFVCGWTVSQMTHSHPSLWSSFARVREPFLNECVTHAPSCHLAWLCMNQPPCATCHVPVEVQMRDGVGVLLGSRKKSWMNARSTSAKLSTFLFNASPTSWASLKRMSSRNWMSIWRTPHRKWWRVTCAGGESLAFVCGRCYKGRRMSYRAYFTWRVVSGRAVGNGWLRWEGDFTLKTQYHTHV